MNDKDKTKEQLLNELVELRQRATELEKFKAECKETEIKEIQAAQKDGLEFELVKKPIDSNQILFITKSILEGPSLIH